MTAHDIYLIAPEIALASVGGVVVILDLLMRDKRFLPLITVVGLLVPAGLAVALWIDVSAESGGALTGLFDTVVVDKFALFFKFLVLSIVALVVLGSRDFAEKFHRSQGEFYGIILLSAVGMMLVAATKELVSIYVSLELATLPIAALAAFMRDERSSEAGLKFLLLGAVSSALLLYGMVLVYAFTGSTHLDVIAGSISSGSVPFGSNAMLVGITLIVVGFGFKISMVPFQMWVPDVYEGSPTPVAAFLSVASKAAGFAVLLRVFYVAFGSVDVDWSILFAVLAVLSMTVGNLVAILQSNVKRLLGYSTIAQAGYILVGVAAIAASTPGGDVDGLGPSGVLFYLAAYAVTNLAAFFAVMAIANRTGSEQIDDFAGMARRSPFLAGVLALSLISLIGIPPTAGFMGKLYLFNAAVSSDLVWLAVVGVLNSVVSAYYYLRVVKTMFLAPAESEERITYSSPVLVAVAVSAIGILLIGVLPGPLFEVTESAVRTILPAG